MAANAKQMMGLKNCPTVNMAAERGPGPSTDSPLSPPPGHTLLDESELGEFVDDYTVVCVDVFSMPQSGTGVSVEAVDPVFQTEMIEMLKQTGRPCVVCGIHLKSLRGNEFSHYKRMAQARIVRAACSLVYRWCVLRNGIGPHWRAARAYVRGALAFARAVQL